MRTRTRTRGGATRASTVTSRSPARTTSAASACWCGPWAVPVVLQFARAGVAQCVIHCGKGPGSDQLWGCSQAQRRCWEAGEASGGL